MSANRNKVFRDFLKAKKVLPTCPGNGVMEIQVKFYDSHGDRWVSCSSKEQGAKAFGPTGVARLWSDGGEDGFFPQYSEASALGRVLADAGWSLFLPEWVETDYRLAVDSEANDESAFSVMEKAVEGETCIDNYRYTLLLDEAGMAAYEAAMKGGCCGYYDAVVTFNDGRTALVGCNFGH